MTIRNFWKSIFSFTAGPLRDGLGFPSLDFPLGIACPAAKQERSKGREGQDGSRHREARPSACRAACEKPGEEDGMRVCATRHGTRPWRTFRSMEPGHRKARVGSWIAHLEPETLFCGYDADKVRDIAAKALGEHHPGILRSSRRRVALEREASGDPFARPHTGWPHPGIRPNFHNPVAEIHARGPA